MVRQALEPEYRPEIDGLRAVAVIPVILFHAGLGAFAGGFIGVDVFYVISGYLITTIIARSKRAGRFSIIEFYERRARRLLPALFVVLLVTSLFAIAWLAPWPLRDYGQSVVATTLFSSNFLFWHESGYFAPTAELKPLLHTWSLAIEEQFYVIFPLILTFLLRFPIRKVAIGFLIGAVAALVLAEVGVKLSPTSAFYLLPFRAWELMAGVVVALVLLDREQPSGWRAEAGGILGLMAVLLSALLFTEKTPTPSFWTLIPVAGSALIILCARPGTIAGKILSARPLVAIGLISYSAYLWHQPIFALVKARSVEPPSPLMMTALIVLTLGLAWLTWRFVERPFRDRSRIGRRAIFVGAAAQFLILATIGGLLVVGDGLPQRLPPAAQAVWTDIKGDAKLPPECDKPLTAEGRPRCVLNPSGAPRVVVWGDSHGSVLARGLAKQGWAVENFTQFGCPPLVTVVQGARWQDCDNANRGAYAYLLGSGSPDIVILSARWAQSLNPGYFDNGEGGVDDNGQIRLFAAADGALRPATTARTTDDVRRTVKALIAAGKTVVFVGNVPEAGWNVAVRKLKTTMFQPQDVRPLSTSAVVLAKRDASTRALVRDLIGDPRLIYIDTYGLFCDRTLPGRCDLEEQGLVLYRDDDHLSSHGIERVARAVATGLQARMACLKTNPASDAPCARDAIPASWTGAD